MAAYKNIRRLSVYFTLNKGAEPAGITTDMCYPNIRQFTVKPQVFGHDVPNLWPVDIAVNTLKRFKCLQLFNHLHVAEIAGMPNLIAAFKVLEDGVIEVAVGIGKETYFNQRSKNLSTKVMITDKRNVVNNVAHITLFTRYFSFAFNTTATIIAVMSISI